MKIAIIGAGSAGKHLVVRLCEMGQDVVVVDKDGGVLEELSASYDALTIEGNGVDPDVLAKVGIDSDVVLAAVTPFDEVNLLCCCWAKAGGAQHTIARLSHEKFSKSPLVDFQRLGVDRAVVNKVECAREIFEVLDRPGTTEVTSVLGDKVVAVGLRLPRKSPVSGKPLRTFQMDEWFGKVRFIGHVTQKGLGIPNGSSVFNDGEEVYAALPSGEIDRFLDWVMGKRRKRSGKVVLAGGGELGRTLAGLLEPTPIKQVLIEIDRSRAEFAGSELSKCLVLNADATEAATLKEAGVVPGTAFAAVTGDDENNIVCCIQAKQLGAELTIARIDKPEYVPIISSLQLVDKVVSPNISLIRTILEYVRGELVENVGLFHRITGEIQEVAIKPDSKGEGKPISKLKMPRDAIIAAIQRGEDVFVPTGATELRSGDRLAVCCLSGAADKIKSAF